jgi:hypothetical protein
MFCLNCAIFLYEFNFCICTIINWNRRVMRIEMRVVKGRPVLLFCIVGRLFGVVVFRRRRCN